MVPVRRVGRVRSGLPGASSMQGVDKPAYPGATALRVRWGGSQEVGGEVAGERCRRYQPMVGRRPSMTMRASSSAMASVSSYVGREARSLAAARCRRTDGVKRSRSTQVAMRLARVRDTIGPLPRQEWSCPGRGRFGDERGSRSPDEPRWGCVCLNSRREMVVAEWPRR